MKTQREQLRERLGRALGKGRHREAMEVLASLEALEPGSARWPHRRGDLLRRGGHKAEAMAAYEQAVSLYVQEGFLSRAVALAKLVATLEPARIHVLERLDPISAQALRGAGPSNAEIEELVQLTDDLPVLSLRGHDDPPTERIRLFTEQPSSAEPILSSPREPSNKALVLVDESSSVGEPLAGLPSFPLFAELPKEAVLELVSGAELLEFPAGAEVVRQGETADGMFAILAGCARVDLAGQNPALSPLLSVGDLFGEASLLEGETRSANVIGVNHLSVLRIPRGVIQETVTAFPRLGELLFDLLTRRRASNVLERSPLFAGLDADTLKAVADHAQLERAAPGTVLLEEGQPSPGLIIPLTGKVQLAGGQVHRPEAIGPGHVLGLESLFRGEPCPLTATAISEVTYLSFKKEALTRTLFRNPPAFARLAEAAAARP